MKDRMHNPHDTLAKSFLSDLTVAADFLKSHLPAKIAVRCDFSMLKIEPATHIDAKLRQHTTDLLYSLQIDNKPGFIY